MLQRYEKGGEKGASVRALAPDFFRHWSRFYSCSVFRPLPVFPCRPSCRLSRRPSRPPSVLPLIPPLVSRSPRPLRLALLSCQLFRDLLPRTFRALPNLLCPHLLRRPSSLPFSLRPVPFPLPPPLRPSLSLCLPPPPVRPASFPRPTTFLPCCCANLCALPGVPLLRVPAPLPRPVVRAPFGRGAP